MTGTSSPPTTALLKRTSLWGTLLAHLIWMGLQAGALAVSINHVPMGRDYVLADGLAIHVMIVVQTVMGAMLFPVLMRDMGSTAATLGSAAMFFQYSCFLAANPENGLVAWSGVYVGGWLVALAMVAHFAKSTTGKMWGVVGAVGVSAGGLVLAYLRREFGVSEVGFEWVKLGYFGPAMGAMMVLEHGLKAGGAWVFLGGVLLLTGGGEIAARLISRKNRK